MGPDAGQGSEESRVSGAVQRGTGEFGALGKLSLSSQKVKEKSELRGKREVCGKWNTNVSYLGCFPFVKHWST